MAWKMDSHGNWTNTGGSGEKKSGSDSGTKTPTPEKSTTDKGNTSSTSESIKISTENKENQLKYAEEATFEIEGDFRVRRGGKMKIRNGVAERWKGVWTILEVTHTVDSRGYKTEGVLGRIPYREEKKKKKSGNDSGSGNSGGGSSGGGDNKKPTTPKKPKSGDTGKKWVMDPDGTWRYK